MPASKIIDIICCWNQDAKQSASSGLKIMETPSRSVNLSLQSSKGLQPQVCPSLHQIHGLELCWWAARLPLVPGCSLATAPSLPRVHHYTDSVDTIGSRHHASELYLDLDFLRMPDMQIVNVEKLTIYLSIIAFTTIMYVLCVLFLKIPLAGLS